MLKAYASYFVSYLLNNLKNIKDIERIILYGSVAKEESTKESDVDLFIEVKKKTKRIETEIIKLEKRFHQSREATLFKLQEINNPISIKTGRLQEWKELQRSIASTGIVLYGPYESTQTPDGLNHKIIIFWDKININRGSFLNKIYGFNVKGNHYLGLLEKYNGEKLGKSCVLFPIQYKNEILKLVKNHRVEAKTIEVFC